MNLWEQHVLLTPTLVIWALWPSPPRQLQISEGTVCTCLCGNFGMLFRGLKPLSQLPVLTDAAHVPASAKAESALSSLPISSRHPAAHTVLPLHLL